MSPEEIEAMTIEEYAAYRETIVEHSGQGMGETHLSEAAMQEILDIMAELTEEDERRWQSSNPR